MVRDFPILELLDERRCQEWLERYLHPAGLRCPGCGSANRRQFRQQQHFAAYRCRDCDGYCTLLTGTVFAKTRQSPATLVLLLRGIAKGQATASLARELSMTRQQVLVLRQRIEAQQSASVADQVDQTTEQHRELVIKLREGLKRRLYVRQSTTNPQSDDRNTD
jgi:transposase-like protein